MRFLEEHAGPIARIGFGASGSSVGQVQNDLDALQDDVMGFSTFNIHDKPDPAGILFEPRIVETLPRRVAVAAWLNDARIGCVINLPISP